MTSPDEAAGALAAGTAIPALDTSQRLASTCLIGAYLAVNAIPDAYLLVDAPDCAHLKAQFVHGNHDWMSTLVSISGYHRIANTALHCWKVISKRDEQIVGLLDRIARFEGSGLVLMTSMPMATITGVDYERLVRRVAAETGKDCFHVVDRALDGDWLDGYAEVLLSLARSVTIPQGIAREPGCVALVGYLMDRTEEDHRGNLRELRRLLGALGVEISTVWAGAEPWADMKRGLARASAIVSLPYGRKAARTLSSRFGLPLVETRLPFGLKGSAEWIRDVAAALGRAEAGERLVESELSSVLPKLEFAVPYQFLHRRLVFVGDPYLAHGFLELAEELGCRVPLAVVTARPHNAAALSGLPPGTELLVDPRIAAFQGAMSRFSAEADLVVTSNTSMGSPGEHYLEFGFPCYERHALYDRPFLGFRGCVAFVDDMAQVLRRVEQSRRAQETRSRERDRSAG